MCIIIQQENIHFIWENILDKLINVIGLASVINGFLTFQLLPIFVEFYFGVIWENILASNEQVWMDLKGRL